MAQQQQQTLIKNFFKLVPKEPQSDEASTEKAPLSQASEPHQEASSRKSAEKRPSTDPASNGNADAVEAKRPRLSVAETPPRSQQPPTPSRASATTSPFAFFAAASPTTGKENQRQLMDAQPAAVQALAQDFGPSWLQALKSELAKAYFVKLAEFVRGERAGGKTIYPPPSDVFSWTRACRLQEVKVVILGQDPYHGPNQAHGLCFSVRRPTPPPPSLLNIFKEVGNNFPEKFQPPGHGDLTGWAEQGVLLLNAVLTVRRGEPNSHQGRGWETFTDAVVATLNVRLSGLVFILWGNYAQKKGAKIDKRKHKVICGAHPSPLAVNRGGFFGKMYFKEANDYLKSLGKPTIDWCRLP